ncbi:hypothetical protein CHUAL_003788 [Chamberlinius hualienensis]
MVAYWIYIIFILCKFQKCLSLENSEFVVNDPTYPTTSDWQTPTSIDEDVEKANIESHVLKKIEDSRGFRVGLFGGGFRNMTVNLSNLAVLGLGMAAAVSLFSFFDNPNMGFRRSIDNLNNEELINFFRPMIGQFLLQVDNETNSHNSKDDHKSKPVENVNYKRENVSQQLSELLKTVTKFKDFKKPLRQS